MNIYVANIAYATTEDQLKSLFSQHGEVSSVKIIFDRVTNRSRGFGFVEMTNDEEAKAAIEEINGFEFMGKQLLVNESRPREDKPRGNYNGGGGFRKNNNY